MWSIRSGKLRGALCASVMAGLLLLVSVPAIAGPLGAPGDVYVRTTYEFIPNVNFNAIMQFDGATGAYVGHFADTYNRAIMGMNWSPNGNLFLTTNTSLNGEWDIREFDGQTGVELGVRYTYPSPNNFSVAKGIAFAPNGDLFVGDWALGQVQRLDGTTFEILASTGGIGTPNGMTIAPNGNLMVIQGDSSGAGMSTVLEFDISGGGLAPLGTFGTFPGSIQAQSLDFGPDGNLYLSGGVAGGVGKLDGTTGAFISNLVPGSQLQPTNGLVADDYGRVLASVVYTPNGQDQNRVQSYDRVTGAYLGEFIPAGTGGMKGVTIMSIKPIPEPAAFALLLIGGALVAVKRRGFGG